MHSTQVRDEENQKLKKYTSKFFLLCTKLDFTTQNAIFKKAI